jgi:hypothetical protein
MEVSGQLHATDALPLRNGPRYSLDKRMDGSTSRSELSGKKENTPYLLGIEPRSSRP